MTGNPGRCCFSCASKQKDCQNFILVLRLPDLDEVFRLNEMPFQKIFQLAKSYYAQEKWVRGDKGWVWGVCGLLDTLGLDDLMILLFS